VEFHAGLKTVERGETDCWPLPLRLMLLLMMMMTVLGRHENEVSATMYEVRSDSMTHIMELRLLLAWC